MKRIFRFIKNWALPFAILAGAVSYFVYQTLPLSLEMRGQVSDAVTVVQPALLFMMLFLTFCKISPQQLRPHRWHWKLLAIQTLSFAALSFVAVCFPAEGGVRILLEGAMVMMICPTATAAAVITGRLGGNVSGLVSYIIISNFVISLWSPLFLSFVNPHSGMNFGVSFFLILGKVFPLLICPLMLAWMVRYMFPSLHKRLQRYTYLTFHLWAISLSLAICVTTRNIVHSSVSIWYMVGLAIVSLLCCIVQFWSGRRIGKRFGEQITAGQALGQKNTVFSIWMAYTFLSPITAVAGGFYSVWHNVFNSWQLYEERKRKEVLDSMGGRSDTSSQEANHSKNKVC